MLHFECRQSDNYLYFEKYFVIFFIETPKTAVLSRQKNAESVLPFYDPWFPCGNNDYKFDVLWLMVDVVITWYDD